MIEESLRQELLDDATLTGLVGTRVYPGHRPQGSTEPAVTLRLARRTPLDDLNGNIGIEQSLFQIEAWATDYATAHQVAAAVIDVLEDFTGTMGSGETTTVEDCQRLVEQDALLPPVDASDTPIEYVPIQFLITHH